MKALIAIDSSHASEQVLDLVSKRTWPQHAELRIVTFVEPCPQWETEEEFLRQAEHILKERVASLKKAVPHNKIGYEAIEGSAAEMIGKTAEDWGADIIVIGSHGDTGVRKSHIGSVAAAVVNTAPCTVELVKIRKVADDGDRQTARAASISN